MKHIHTIKLPATKGTHTIARAEDIFSWIDSDFENYGTNKKGSKTAEMELAVCELTEDMTFKHMFTKPEEMCLSQAQIIEFCQNHTDKLRQDGYATLFLFKVGSEFFVALVNVYSDGLYAFVYPFSRDFVWNAEYRYRIVLPANSIQIPVSESQSNSLPDRFFSKVQKGEKTNSCWLWKGAIDGRGYGSFYLDGLVCGAHRVSYEMAKGQIPDGLVIDHICRVKNCVNPDHLRAITRIENVMIGEGPTAVNSRKTHCNRGHKLSGNNMYLHKGKRYCIACRHSPKFIAYTWEITLKIGDKEIVFIPKA